VVYCHAGISNGFPIGMGSRIVCFVLQPRKARSNIAGIIVNAFMIMIVVFEISLIVLPNGPELSCGDEQLVPCSSLRGRIC